jgi:hypothetical protein
VDSGDFAEEKEVKARLNLIKMMIQVIKTTINRMTKVKAMANKPMGILAEVEEDDLEDLEVIGQDTLEEEASVLKRVWSIKGMKVDLRKEQPLEEEAEEEDSGADSEADSHEAVVAFVEAEEADFQEAADMFQEDADVDAVVEEEEEAAELIWE